MTPSEYQIATGQVSEQTRRAMKQSTDARVDAYAERAETEAERKMAEFLKDLRVDGAQSAEKTLT